MEDKHCRSIGKSVCFGWCAESKAVVVELGVVDQALDLHLASTNKARGINGEGICEISEDCTKGEEEKIKDDKSQKRVK